MQIRDKKKPGQKSHQKSDLGTSWGPFGRVRGKFWEGFGSSWGFLGCFGNSFFSCLYVEWSSKVLLEPSGLDFGSILMDFGMILGRFWEGFGKVWEEFANILGHSGPLWTILGCWGVLGRFSQDFGWCSLLQWNSFWTQALAGSIACFCFLLLALACLGWLWLALAALAAWLKISFMLGSFFAHVAQA